MITPKSGNNQKYDKKCILGSSQWYPYQSFCNATDIQHTQQTWEETETVLSGQLHCLQILWEQYSLGYKETNSCFISHLIFWKRNINVNMHANGQGCEQEDQRHSLAHLQFRPVWVVTCQQKWATIIPWMPGPSPKVLPNQGLNPAGLCNPLRYKPFNTGLRYYSGNPAWTSDSAAGIFSSSGDYQAAVSCIMHWASVAGHRFQACLGAAMCHVVGGSMNWAEHQYYI